MARRTRKLGWGTDTAEHQESEDVIHHPTAARRRQCADGRAHTLRHLYGEPTIRGNPGRFPAPSPVLSCTLLLFPAHHWWCAGLGLGGLTDQRGAQTRSTKEEQAQSRKETCNAKQSHNCDATTDETRRDTTFDARDPLLQTEKLGTKDHPHRLRERGIPSASSL